MRFSFHEEVAQRFVISILAVRALETVQSPNGSTPGTIGFPLAIAREKQQGWKRPANRTIAFGPGLGNRKSSDKVFSAPFQRWTDATSGQKKER
jgi:hypothetical protein